MRAEIVYRGPYRLYLSRPPNRLRHAVIPVLAIPVHGQTVGKDEIKHLR